MSASGDYRLPDPEAAAAALAAALELRAEPARTIAWVYYDTFDGLARAAGLDIRHANGRLAALDRATCEERTGARRARPPARADRADLPELASVITVRALTPIARGESREQRFAVLNEDTKTVVRLTLESARLKHGKRLNGRLHVHPVRGYDDEAAQLRATLEEQLGFKPAKVSLADEAVSAEGGVPGGTSSKLELELDPAQPASTAVAEVARRLLAIIAANLPGTLADVDTEFLHDLRVAVRRTRSLQRQLKATFPPGPLADARAEFKELQRITGDVRDLDVHLLEFGDVVATLPPALQPDLEPLRGVLAKRRARAFTTMKRDLTSARTEAALRSWSGLVDLGRTGAPIARMAGERIAKVYAQMVKEGGAIDGESPAEDYHELRKKGKELRYLLEFFGGLYPAEVVKPMVKALKALQDVLGRHQDREVQAAELHSLRDDVAKTPGGPAALMAMGVLVERLGREEAAARAEFAEQFAQFAAPGRRALVKEAFAP